MPTQLQLAEPTQSATPEPVAALDLVREWRTGTEILDLSELDPVTLAGPVLAQSLPGMQGSDPYYFQGQLSSSPEVLILTGGHLQATPTGFAPVRYPKLQYTYSAEADGGLTLCLFPQGSCETLQPY